jgi:hypothetical protein
MTSAPLRGIQLSVTLTVTVPVVCASGGIASGGIASGVSHPGRRIRRHRIHRPGVRRERRIRFRRPSGTAASTLPIVGSTQVPASPSPASVLQVRPLGQDALV